MRNCFMQRFIFFVMLLFCGWHAVADDYLAPEKAFKFSARMLDAKTIEVNYAIANGYYMYRERFAFKAEGATLGTPEIPAGVIKFDETFNKNVETYHQHVSLRLPVQAAAGFTLIVTSQGCADQGLCYPPMESRAQLGGGTGLRDALGINTGATLSSGVQQNTPAIESNKQTQPGRIEASLKSGNIFLIAPLFLLLGLGLAFTPCVLPMVPILSAIIIGEKNQMSRRRGFLLSVTYALGMALIYTALGVAAGLAGEGLAASLQNPWVLSAFALLMVGMALSMFGFYQIQLPSRWQSTLSQLSHRQPAGKLVGVFMMGALSALIVGPCVAAPLAGALLYISQTRDVLVGASALFALAAGMSIPLLLVGVSAGTVLPRVGQWMNAVKYFFGVLMLALALWMISPVIPTAVAMLAWAVLGIGYAAFLLWGGQSAWWLKALGMILMVLGVVQLAGMLTGGRDVLNPFAHLIGKQEAPLPFIKVRSVAELESALAQARGKPALLDFYADWCVSCKEMERFTFTNPQVRARLDDMVLLQIDVTANNPNDKAMLKHFGLFGAPGILFFNRAGQEQSRVIGFQNATDFLQSLSVLD